VSVDHTAVDAEVEAEAPPAPPPSRRRHDLDALRGFAMLLGIALHASLAFFPAAWVVSDHTATDDGFFDEFFHAVHGFRMPLFFLLSGFFTALLWHRRGLGPLLSQRAKRIAIPLAIGVVTIVPLVDWVVDDAVRSANGIAAVDEAIFIDDLATAQAALADGFDVDARAADGSTAVHLAALVGNPEMVALFLDAGADPNAESLAGDIPLAWAYFAGTSQAADVLVAYGSPDWRPPGSDWADIDDWGFGAETREAILDPERTEGPESWIDRFHHLWFLWFLTLFAVLFGLAAAAVDALRRHRGAERLLPAAVTTLVMWSLLPLTLLPHSLMGSSGEIPVFGPDTSTGLVPTFHVFVYYGIFFTFGVLLYGARGRGGGELVDNLGRGWWIILPITLVVVLPVALGVTFDDDGSWPTAVGLQVLFAWGMIFGLIGLFRHFLGQRRRGVRYLSDSAYWLYLAHLPLVIWMQSQIRTWDLPAPVKFAFVCVVATSLLLATYQLFVRYSPIGTLLNGKRTRPSDVTAPPA